MNSAHPPGMKIGVDGFNMSLEKGTGVATYARNLTYCLHDLGHEVHVLYGRKAAADKTSLMQEISFFDEYAFRPDTRLQQAIQGLSLALRPGPRKAHQIPLSGAVIYNQFFDRMPRFDKLWNAPRIFERGAFTFRLHGKRLPVRIPASLNVMHWTYPLPLRVAGARNIYTMHDLVPLRLPYTTLDRKRYYYKLMQALARDADHILTVSETSKADIMSLLGVPEERVTNTYQAVEIPERYLSVPAEVLKEELRGTFNLEYKKYFLCYGSIEPKKNIGRIVEAYLASNLQIPLVIVGAQAWRAEDELRLIKHMPGPKDLRGQSAIKHMVIQFDYAPFRQLVNLIRGALAITFPSLYEGFGLPILEGMICETPVITSNIGSMKEVAGDAGILVDPYNTGAIKVAMIAVANNPELCQEKAVAGRTVAKRFSQDAYQQRLLEVYGRLKL